MCAKKMGLDIPKVVDVTTFLPDGWSVRERGIARQPRRVSPRQVRRCNKRLGARHMMALWEDYTNRRCHSVLARLTARHSGITQIPFPATRVRDPYTGGEHLFVLIREEDGRWDWHCRPKADYL